MPKWMRLSNRAARLRTLTLRQRPQTQVEHAYGPTPPPIHLPATLRPERALRVRTAQPVRLQSGHIRQSVRVVRGTGEDL